MSIIDFDEAPNMKSMKQQLNSKTDRSSWQPRYAERMNGVQASEIRELLKVIDQPDMISFAGGIPEPTLFPTDNIRAIYNDILSSNEEACKALQYSVSEGDSESSIVDRQSYAAKRCAL